MWRHKANRRTTHPTLTIQQPVLQTPQQMTPKISTNSNATTPRHHHAADAELREPGFRGYTISEIRYQLILNHIKTEITRNQLMQIVSPPVQRTAGYASWIRSFIRYFDIAILSYTIFRKLTSIIRIFRPRSR